MPNYKDPDRNNEYMRNYMRKLRLTRRLEKAARIERNRTAFLAREAELQQRKTNYD